MSKNKYPNLINENSNKKTTKEKEDKSTKKQDKIKLIAKAIMIARQIIKEKNIADV